MADHYEFSIQGHHNIYNNNAREFTIHFSTPSKGVGKDTGMLLLIPGYGGNVSSNVYKKMRDTFADQYNLIVVQCHYFGQEFMQSELIHEESYDNFNDMSFMQALDNITAVLIVIQIMRNKNLPIHYGKIILYGQSHGAYLSYLCNAFAPQLFKLLIDNSSYLYPLYMISDRILQLADGQVIRFHYLISNEESPENEILYLPLLYKKFPNECSIISFNGTNDVMVPVEDKTSFINGINKARHILIDDNNVDGQIFTSTTHGLGADFLRLFDYVMNTHRFTTLNELQLVPHRLHTKQHVFSIDFEDDFIQLSIQQHGKISSY
ncbi:DUF2920 family protein [Paenibacillus aquistagni]|uniref:DUF2920 family protein n=1 Tax=Paenibacillus aquistagni TaxID=1852522 RepID=UPI000B4FE3D6|nr:DUF2920 family protein [Paenibacillus aquistagni]